MEGPNKQGGWKSGGSRKLGLTVQQPAQIQNTPINITGSKHFSESCQINLTHYLGNSAEVPTFCRFLPEKIENLTSGGS